jgi:DNA transposition AAA+ family ATPase
MNGNEKQATPEIKARLEEFMKLNGLTLKRLGARVGKSEAFVSRYFGDTPVGDLEEFERAVLDMLDSAQRKRTWAEIYFDTEAIKMCNMVFDIIREAADIGLVHGPAGIGKTTACERYANDHKTVIHFVADEGNGHAYGVIAGIWAKIETRFYDPKKQKRGEFLKEKLTGSERLIIVDNAQRLNMSGLRWLFDFHDATGVSIALVGNPEVLDRMRGNDQMTSRIGFKQDIAEMLDKGGWLDKASDKMIAAMWPKAASDIGPLARETARKQGHLRTLKKQLRIAIRLCETDAYRGKPGKAFTEARHLIGADNTED